MKPVKDILRSPRLMREVSQLLFVFAALGGFVGLLSFFYAGGDLEILGAAAGFLIQSTIYAMLAVMIRRGSIIALWIAGAFFALDTLLILAVPVGQGIAIALFARIVLIGMLVRFVRRERLSD
jgi:hypothetical protein